MERERVLIVFPNAFHLGWMGATQRIFHLAHALRALGFEVVLLAGMTVGEVAKGVDSAFPGLVIRTEHSGAYPRILDRNRYVRRIWRGFWKLRGHSYYLQKLSWGWAERLGRSSYKNILEHCGRRPVFIWGVCVGFLEGAVAGQRLATMLEVPWILEMQDPPRGAGIGRDDKSILQRFRDLLHSANSTVVTAADYGKELQRRFGLSDRRVHTIYLTYERSFDNSLAPKRESCVLSYTGSLNGGRSLDTLVNSLAWLRDKAPEIGASIELHLAGCGDGFGRALIMAKESGLRQQLIYHGVVDSDGASKIIRASDALVIVQPSHSAMQVPGKLFQQICTGKPILALMPDGCEAAGILRRSGVGFVHLEHDVEGVAGTLIKLWKAWRTEDPIVSPNWSVIEEFSLSRLHTKLARVLPSSVMR